MDNVSIKAKGDPDGARVDVYNQFAPTLESGAAVPVRLWIRYKGDDAPSVGACLTPKRARRIAFALLDAANAADDRVES